MKVFFILGHGKTSRNFKMKMNLSLMSGHPTPLIRPMSKCWTRITVVQEIGGHIKKREGGMWQPVSGADGYAH